MGSSLTERIHRNTVLVTSKLTSYTNMQTYWRSYLSRGVFSALMLMVSFPIAATPVTNDCKQLSSQTVSNNTQSELITLVDATVKSQMLAHGIPGLTISIVKDEQIILSKGFGVADLQTQQVVDPNSTLFRIGSISKTFTWVAVMQLVEAGKIDLNKSINMYLNNFHIPEQFDRAITMTHLMTHSAGFEDGFAGYLFRDDPADVLPLEEWLVKYMPSSVRPPGTLVSYSNYGSALAGYIVQEVSGKPFNDYVEQHIFRPLAMKSSTFREPLGPEHPGSIAPQLAERFSTGYIRSKGRNKPFHFEFASQVAPAGSGSTTASDMALYMLSLLPEKHLKCTRILNDKTLARMQQRQLANAEQVFGMAHGFIHYKVGEYEVFTHSGGTSSFLSNLVLVPELGLGIFISANSTASREPIEQIPALLVEHFYPFHKRTAYQQPTDEFIEGAARFAGDYLTTRRSYTRLEKLLSLASEHINVSVDPEGYLLMTSNGLTSSWVEVATRTFRKVGDDEIRIFDEDINGNITRLHPNIGVFAYDRLSFFQTPFFLLLSLMCVGFFSLTSLINSFFRRRQGQSRSDSILWARQLTSITAISGCCLIAMVAIALGDISALGPEIAYHWPPRALFAVLCLVILLTGLTLILGVSLVPVWIKANNWSIWQKLHYTTLTLSCCTFVAACYEWNMIGFKYY